MQECGHRSRHAAGGLESTIRNPPSSRRVPGIEDDIMPTVMAHHDVKDQKHWLASPKREEVFGPLGVTNIRKFIDPENATRVGIVMDVADMDKLMAAMEDQEMRDAMEYDGVVPESLVILVEA
jgi:hypothetical protein